MSEEHIGKQSKQPQTRKTHLSVHELAERWGVSENYIRRLVWRAELKCTRLGRSMRIPIEEVEAYAREHTGAYSHGYRPTVDA